MTIKFHRNGTVSHAETERVIGGWRKEPDRPPYKGHRFRVWRTGETPEQGKAYWPRYWAARYFSDIDLAHELGYLDETNDPFANEQLFVRGRSDQEIARSAEDALTKLPPLPLRVGKVDGHDCILNATGDVFIRGVVYRDGVSGLSGEESVLSAMVEVVNAVSHLAERAGEEDVAEELRRLPARPWELWTSCGYNRISKSSGGDGHALTADRHGELSLSERSLRALCRVVSDAESVLERVLANAGPRIT